MRNNLPAASQRISEVGLVWEEKITNATGSIEVPIEHAIRVRATGATTVTIDGVLAATMSSGEIMIFNSGDGAANDDKRTVTVVIGAAAAFVQVGREIPNKGRRRS